MKRNAIFAYWMRRELTEVGMNAINKEPERHEIEALLPWYAAGTLSRRDADRVEQALASDRELARRYDLVREELAETIHLNETLGAPSARAMEKLFAAIDAEEARAPRRQRQRISRTPSLATASILNR
jgi:anti-sigma-K factor RskA